ncbi:hypothetical protein MOW14_14815 (plasmid) [Acinetobacter indicus]|uniref:hypothetical protein n=1 Tax=Acinetobacter indicus TaxID=756892 RepID=UPI001FA75943|nr:hypothetical protein [Acinetobacter indicus]UNW11100.1 hypothetical protein MOW14_14815 [Acinetobacter indicus]
MPVFEAQSYMGSSFTLEIDNDFLEIYDHNLGRTVTNDAERVVERVAQYLKECNQDISQFKIVYQDSMGVWDAMTVRDGKFSGFIGLGALDEEHAKRLYDQKATAS